MMSAATSGMPAALVASQLALGRDYSVLLPTSPLIAVVWFICFLIIRKRDEFKGEFVLTLLASFVLALGLMMAAALAFILPVGLLALFLRSAL